MGFLRAPLGRMPAPLSMWGGGCQYSQLALLRCAHLGVPSRGQGGQTRVWCCLPARSIVTCALLPGCTPGNPPFPSLAAFLQCWVYGMQRERPDLNYGPGYAR